MNPSEPQDEGEHAGEDEGQIEAIGPEEIEEIPIEDEAPVEEGDDEKEKRRERLTTLRSIRTDTRTAMGPQLNACGLLLTLTLGAIYFVITDNRQVSVNVHGSLSNPLFGIFIVLTFSIACGLMAIYSRPIPTGIGELALEGSLSKSISTERRYAKLSTGLLMLAIVLILYSLYMFHGSSYLEPTTNFSDEKSTIVVMIIPYQGLNLSFDNLTTKTKNPLVPNRLGVDDK
jgi:hypothetical protein